MRKIHTSVCSCISSVLAEEFPLIRPLICSCLRTYRDAQHMLTAVEKVLIPLYVRYIQIQQIKTLSSDSSNELIRDAT